MVKVNKEVILGHLSNCASPPPSDMACTLQYFIPRRVVSSDLVQEHYSWVVYGIYVTVERKPTFYNGFVIEEGY